VFCGTHDTLKIRKLIFSKRLEWSRRADLNR
jgi:hypothetical protein